MTCEGIENFGIVIIICYVWKKETPINQHIFNMQTIWQLLAGVLLNSRDRFSPIISLKILAQKTE